jgi:hypothetical protein
LKIHFYKKVTLAWVVLFIFTFGCIQLEAASYNSKIKNNIIYNVAGNKAFVNLDKNFNHKYKSGIIVSKIFSSSRNTKKHLAIVSNAVIDKVYKRYAIIKFIKIKKIKAQILFDTSLKAKNGDKFILNSERSLSLLIAPNYESYSYVVKHYPKMRFITIDLFAMYLKSIRKPLPQKEHFISFCDKNLIADIMIVLEGKLLKVDCYSFKQYDSINLQKRHPKTREHIQHGALSIKDTNKKQMSPFFTNIINIEKGFFDLKFYDNTYNEHYKMLLNDK